MAQRLPLWFCHLTQVEVTFQDIVDTGADRTNWPWKADRTEPSFCSMLLKIWPTLKDGTELEVKCQQFADALALLNMVFF